jgi:hypothetical protein
MTTTTNRPLLPWAGGEVRRVGAWDTRDDDWWRWWLGAGGLDWAEAHMAPHNTDTFRAEFVETDAGPAVIMWRFKNNDQGRRYIDPATGDPAELPPVIMALDEFPPPELLTCDHGAAAKVGGDGLPEARRDTDRR